MAISLVGVIVSGIFFVVSHLVDGVLSPIISTVIGMFPSLAPAFTNVVTFLTYAFTYLTTILRWFLFTPNMWLMLFDYFIIKYSVWVIGATVRLTIRMFHYLKPT